ncbi:hypothetical protein JCM3775_006582 [Rhodotorula graminis]
MVPPPSLLDYLSAQLSASVPGKHRYAIHVLRSEPQRSHALFPHATNANLAKVWHEETLVVLSERRQVPLDVPQAATGAPSTASSATVGDAPDASASASAAPVASTSTAAASPPPPAGAAAAAAASETRSALVPIVALEASLYFIPSTSCALLYISKVDTTGLSSPSSSSPTRTLVSAFVAHHLVHPPHGARRLRVHVFARAQSQYLFPGSADNSRSKRVLDDKQLLRWWKATLERASSMALREGGGEGGGVGGCGGEGGGEGEARDIRKWYLVPGLAHVESLPYLPSTGPGWTYGHPYASLSSPLHRASDPPSAHPLPDHVPAFADDPKSRFLHSLTSSPVAPSGTEGDYDDAYSALGSATWSAGGATPAHKVAELERQVDRERRRLVAGVPGGVDEWWERMAFRQECCAGQLVGFFVVAVGEPAPAPSSSSSSSSASTSTSAANLTIATSTAPLAAAPPSPTTTSSITTKPPTAHAPKRHPLALRPAQYTKHWSTLHNFDYALPALARLASAVERWSDGVERAVRGTCEGEGEDGEGEGTGRERTGREGEGREGAGEGEGEGEGAAAGQGAQAEDKERAWRARYEREVARELSVDNPPLPSSVAGAVVGQASGVAGEKRPAEGEGEGASGAAAGGGGGAAGSGPGAGAGAGARAGEAPKVNVLAPRKKKKKVEGAA